MKYPPGVWCTSCFALAGMVGLSACGQDPLVREGSWNPTHINRANLASMVANPADLARGSGTSLADAQLAVAAIERLRTDKVKKLPASDIATLTAGNSGDNNSSPSGAQ